MFVIWEPVLETDWGTPSQSLTGDVPDRRVEHFWDHDRRLSAIYGGAPELPSLAGVEKVGFRMKDVVWDTAILYPPGVQWGQAGSLLVAPVFKFQTELAAALQ